eukprot:scaffold66164_cov66-Phaeocystis_antarctica.AAC.5
MAWVGQGCRGRHRSSPPCCQPPAASAPPPAPVVAPPRSSAAQAPPPAPPPPAPPATVRRTAPPPRRWQSSPGAPSYHRASPAPDRAWVCRAGRRRRSSPSCCRSRAAPRPPSLTTRLQLCSCTTLRATGRYSTKITPAFGFGS